MSSTVLVEQIKDITKRYIFYSSLINLLVGSISNVLIILIFTTIRTFRKNQCAFYLTVEAIVNIGVLFAYLPFNIAGELLGQNPAQLSLVWCKIQSMGCYVFGSCSVFTLVSLAFDQYLSTNHRPQWRQKSTIKLAHRLTFINVCCAILHSILFLIFAEIGILGCTIYHPITKTYLKFFFFPILNGILPITISGIFCLLAYWNVRRIIRRQVSMVRRRLDRQMTAIALARILCIVILGVPFLCTTSYEFHLNNRDDNPKELAIYRLSSAMAYSLLYANYAINFYVFIFISPRFRHQVKQFFMKKCWHYLPRVCSLRLPFSMNNQVSPETIQRHASVIESL